MDEEKRKALLAEAGDVRFQHEALTTRNIIPRVPPKVRAAEAPNRDAETDFRRVHWGASMQEVIDCEPLNLVWESGDTIVYQATLKGLNATVLFNFVNNQLARGSYKFEDNYADLNSHIENFMELKATLEYTHGSAVSDEVEWKDERYISDLQNWGKCVSLGLLELSCTWSTDRTDILLFLYGESHEISFILNYRSKQHHEQLQELFQKKRLEGL